MSGTSRDGREQLDTLLKLLDAGDQLVVTRLDRLARNSCDLQNIVREIGNKGASLRCLEQPIDTSTSAGKLFLDMLGAFGEFETNNRRDRQAEGIAAAKVKGVYKGRKPVIDPAKVHALKTAGVGASDIARHLSISRQSVYRVLQ